jgi:nitrate/nitrite transport system substrate-binding protein
VTPPAEMIANLRAGNIDGFLGPDPFNQRAVYDQIGFIHILSKDIWNGHPCCAFGASQAFIDQNPNTFAALYRAILNATAMAHKQENRAAIAKAISTPGYLNQPEIVVLQALSGRFADGLGNVRNEPDRADFDAMPWYSMATWMLTQMKRWGYIKGDVDYKALAEKVFLLTDARKQMAALGMPVGDAAKSGYRSFTIMGKTYDPSNPQGYLDSFAIKHT